jgi:hypothetical protein
MAAAMRKASPTNNAKLRNSVVSPARKNGLVNASSKK